MAPMSIKPDRKIHQAVLKELKWNTLVDETELILRRRNTQLLVRAMIGLRAAMEGCRGREHFHAIR